MVVGMARPRSWTDDDLRRVVPASLNWAEVHRHLGLTVGGKTLRSLAERARALGVDVSHLRAADAGRRRPQVLDGSRRSWTDAELALAVDGSTSIAGVLRRLGLQPGGGTYVLMRRSIERLGLDTAHFDGQGWRRGWKGAPGGQRARPLSMILVAGSTYPTHALRRRLIAEGVKPARCEMCLCERWRNLPAPLQLDHVNGDRTDHRLENLRILCANCHAQTDTWCGRNRGRYG